MVELAPDEIVDRFLENALTIEVLQQAHAKAHLSGGDLSVFAEELRNAICAPENGNILSLNICDRSGHLPTKCGRLGVAEGKRTRNKDLLSCVHCFRPLTVEVSCCAACQEPSASEEPSEVPERCAYATLLYGSKVEYILGALVTGWSLETSGSRMDRLLLHTDDVATEFLELLSHYWTFKRVDYLQGSPNLYKNWQSSRFKAVFTKLQALSCTEYSKVLMLDLDLLIRGNIDELFQLRAPAALKRASGKSQPEHGGAFRADDMWRERRDDMCSGINAGVMLLKPDMAVYRRMVAEISDSSHPEHIGTHGPEQDYLARFYSTFFTGEWRHIHARYNYQPMLPADYCSEGHKALSLLRDVVVVHYSGPRVKPWELVEGESLGAEAVTVLLENDAQVWSRFSRVGRVTGGSKPGMPRTRVMDDVPVTQTDSSAALPQEVQTVMWEWVEALRSCVQDLGRKDLDLLEIIRNVERSNPPSAPEGRGPFGRRRDRR